MQHISDLHSKFALGPHHLFTIAQICPAMSSQLRHVSTIGKMAKQQYLLHMFSQYGELSPLAAEIGLPVWGTPANFNGFWVLASLLHRRHSTEVSHTARCLAVSWAGTLSIHFRGCCPLTEFCHMQNLLSVQVLHSPIFAALLHGTRTGRQFNFAAFSRGSATSCPKFTIL